jgi:hypothetical protein
MRRLQESRATARRVDYSCQQQSHWNHVATTTLACHKTLGKPIDDAFWNHVATTTLACHKMLGKPIDDAF